MYRKPSAFNFWLSQNRDSLEEESPELGASEIIKLAMQTWKNLSNDEKKVSVFSSPHTFFLSFLFFLLFSLFFIFISLDLLTDMKMSKISMWVLVLKGNLLACVSNYGMLWVTM